MCALVLMWLWYLVVGALALSLLALVKRVWACFTPLPPRELLTLSGDDGAVEPAAAVRWA